MNPNNLTKAEWADFSRNAATQVAAGKVTGLLPEQVLAISNGLSDGADELTDLVQLQVALRAATIEVTQKLRDTGVRMSRRVQSLKYTMKSVRSPADQFVAVGFDPPVRSRQTVTPQRPTELAVTGFSNGVNSLKFTGNNTPNSVRYMSSRQRSATLKAMPLSGSQKPRGSGIWESRPEFFTNTASEPRPPATLSRTGRTRLLFIGTRALMPAWRHHRRTADGFRIVPALRDATTSHVASGV